MTPQLFGCALDFNQVASFATIASFIIALIAFPFIYRQLSAANASTGITTLIYLQTTIDDIGRELKKVNEDESITDVEQWQAELKPVIARLMNVLESTCTLFCAGAYTGSIRNHIKSSMINLLDTLENSDDTLNAIKNSIENKTDFSSVRKFICETDAFPRLRVLLSNQVIIYTSQNRYEPWLRY